MWPVAPVLNNTDYGTFLSLQEVRLDRAGLELVVFASGSKTGGGEDEESASSRVAKLEPLSCLPKGLEDVCNLYQWTQIWLWLPDNQFREALEITSYSYKIKVWVLLLIFLKGWVTFLFETLGFQLKIEWDWIDCFGSLGHLNGIWLRLWDLRASNLSLW